MTPPSIGRRHVRVGRPRLPTAAQSSPPVRPVLADEVAQFMQMEREVEVEFRSQMLVALQSKVDRAADSLTAQAPICRGCCRLPQKFRSALSANSTNSMRTLWKPSGHSTNSRVASTLKQWCAIPWRRWINFPTLPHASEKIWLRASQAGKSGGFRPQNT
jgi:hypothetical protein